MKYSGPEGQPSDNLFVRGLPPNTTHEAAKLFFEGFGFTVARHRIIPDKESGACHGVLVQLTSVEEAGRCLERLQNHQVEDAFIQTLPTNGTNVPFFGSHHANDQKGTCKGTGKRKGMQVNFSRQNGEVEQPNPNLYLRNLPSSVVDKESLTELFQDLGFKVEKMKILTDKLETGYCAALVTVDSTETAAAAVQKLHGRVLEADDAPSANGGAFDASDPLGFGPLGHPYYPEFAPQPAPSALPVSRAPIVVMPPSAAVASAPRPLELKYAGDGTPSSGLYITGVPAGATSERLAALFMAAGLTVASVQLLADTTGSGYSDAMVAFVDAEQAGLAILAFSGQVIDRP